MSCGRSANDCACGTPSHRLGCLQCGTTCGPRCAIPTESAVYCRSCAESLLDATDLHPTEPLELN